MFARADDGAIVAALPARRSVDDAADVENLIKILMGGVIPPFLKGVIPPFLADLHDTYEMYKATQPLERASGQTDHWRCGCVGVDPNTTTGRPRAR